MCGGFELGFGILGINILSSLPLPLFYSCLVWRLSLEVLEPDLGDFGAAILEQDVDQGMWDSSSSSSSSSVSGKFMIGNSAFSSIHVMFWVYL